ncbi:MAG: hypothetical protein AAFN51_06635, partial [Pseudomonadota bacterium]
PGGTIAETQFSLTEPENAHQDVNLVTGEAISNAAQHDLTPMNVFLAYAAEAGVKVTLVLPSAQYIGDPARAAVEAEAFVRNVLSGPYADVVETFELGNEWATFFPSAASYGQVADALAKAVVAGAAGTGQDPLIAIQPSAKAARIDETLDIVAQLSEEALDAIDAVVIHDYRPEPWTQQDVSVQKIDHAEIFEIAAERELEIIATEWNVGNQSANDGLLQGAGILDLFQTHLINGVDRAHIWPVLENNTTRLAADFDPNNPDAGADLMIGGEVFRQMVQSLEGTKALNFAAHQDMDGDGSADLLVYGYEGAGRMVVFVASLDAEATDATLQLGDLADIEQSFAHLWVTEITVAEGEDPTAHTTFPVLSQTAASVASDIALSLEPFQISRLEFAAAGAVGDIDTAGLDDLRGTDASEVFVLADDGQRDLVRDFDVEMDRLDVSSFGAHSLDDLTITNLLRSDGSVSWIEISDMTGQAEVILRFESGTLTADRLRDDNFVFAGVEQMTSIPGYNTVSETAALDKIRGTEKADVFQMQDDDQRDLVRDFEDGVDLIDVSRVANEFGELTIRNLVRKDGSVAWVEISDGDGTPELVLRFENGDHDAARLTADDFVF